MLLCIVCDRIIEWHVCYLLLGCLSAAGSFISLQPASAAMVVPSVLDWTARLAAGRLVRGTVSLPNVTPSHARHEIVQAEERFVKLRQKVAYAMRF